MHLHLVYTTEEMLLSKKPYASWREIQDEYESYKASFGPWTRGDVLAFIVDDYPDLEPPAEIQIDEFLASEAETVVLKFKTKA